MEIKDFIGKEFFNKQTKKCYVIEKIDGAYIDARETQPNKYGTYAHYRWMTGTAPYDNAIAKGTLVFKDETLTAPFKEVYEEYRYNEGRMDQYFYYMSKYD